MSWRIEIPMKCPSQNVTDRMHWTKRRALKSAWMTALVLLRNNPRVPKACGKRRLTIEAHGRQAMDTANIIGGTKGIVDNLVQLGLLVDDTPDCLEIAALNVPLPKGEKPHTVLILEDVVA